jgi:hypothetical protein
MVIPGSKDAFTPDIQQKYIIAIARAANVPITSVNIISITESALRSMYRTNTRLHIAIRNPTHRNIAQIRQSIIRANLPVYPGYRVFLTTL